MSGRAYLIAAAFLAVAGCTAKEPDATEPPGAATTADASNDEATLRAQAPVWFDLYNKGDAAGVANLYTEDAVILAPGAPAASGKDAIVSYLTKDIAAAKSGGITMTAGEVTGVGVSGDLAWLTGTFTVNAGGSAVDAGKYVSVYKRVGTDWKLYRDTWNSDRAAAAPAT